MGQDPRNHCQLPGSYRRVGERSRKDFQWGPMILPHVLFVFFIQRIVASRKTHQGFGVRGFIHWVLERVSVAREIGFNLSLYPALGVGPYLS